MRCLTNQIDHMTMKWTELKNLRESNHYIVQGREEERVQPHVRQTKWNFSKQKPQKGHSQAEPGHLCDAQTVWCQRFLSQATAKGIPGA